MGGGGRGKEGRGRGAGGAKPATLGWFQATGEWGRAASLPPPSLQGGQLSCHSLGTRPLTRLPWRGRGGVRAEHSERCTLQAVRRGKAWSMAEASDNGGSVPAQSRCPHPPTFLTPRDFLGLSLVNDPQEEAPGPKSPPTRHPWGGRGRILGGCCLGKESQPREAPGPCCKQGCPRLDPSAPSSLSP